MKLLQYVTVTDHFAIRTRYGRRFDRSVHLTRFMKWRRGLMLIPVLIVVTSYLPATNADTLDGEKVQHAIFVAFQPVDVFSLEEIRASRELIFEAAAQGDDEAILILEQMPSFSEFFDRPPPKAAKRVIREVLDENYFLSVPGQP